MTAADAILNYLREIAANAEEGEVLSAADVLFGAERVAADHSTPPVPACARLEFSAGNGALLMLWDGADEFKMEISHNVAPVRWRGRLKNVWGGGGTATLWWRKPSGRMRRALEDMMRAMDTDAKNRSRTKGP